MGTGDAEGRGYHRAGTKGRGDAWEAIYRLAGSIMATNEVDKRAAEV